MKHQLKSRIKGTCILRTRGRFFKVIETRRTRGNWWTFECVDIESRQSHFLRYEMLGLLEALDAAASVMKDPKDILMIDLDNQGRFRIVPKDQIDRILKQTA